MLLDSSDAELDFDSFDWPTPSTTSRVFGAKPLSSIFTVIRAGAEVGDAVVAFPSVTSVRGRRSLAGDRHGHAWQRGLTLIDHAAGNTGFGLLGQRQAGTAATQQGHKGSEAFMRKRPSAAFGLMTVLLIP